MLKIKLFRSLTEVACILLLIGMTGCTTSNSLAKNHSPKKNFPVSLYITGITPIHIDEPVHFRIIIDNKDTLINKRISPYGYGRPKFTFTLSEGKHQIVAESENGNAGLDVVFEVDKPLWLSLAYYGKNHFQLEISPRPMVFI